MKNYINIHPSFYSSLPFFIQFATSQLKQQKKTYLLALFSVILVIVATSVSQSVIDRAPLIYLKNAEAEVGQFDIILKPTCSNKQ